ncbi:unnamed protein product [Dracunculus medinensis]|uniref:TPR_REGION domain-containing protein n=1 Tax=Dracunculus medinensis TaxID=318479 RepID=A0A158Q635_DRAME|nr:unnamed protein product [Dracunculus medinensis]
MVQIMALKSKGSAPVPNPVVFRDGDGALQILPALIENIPEARLNLIIFHLKRDDVQSAFNLAIGLKAETPQEYLLKAITYCITGYEKSSNKHLETAREYFKVVGESAAECVKFQFFYFHELIAYSSYSDMHKPGHEWQILKNISNEYFQTNKPIEISDTIAGRQAMASAYFLMEQFDKVLIYLNSIKTYFYNDDIFNFNIGQALLACGNSIEAESSLLLVANELLKKQFPYIFSLARSYIFNGKAAQAWQISTRMKQSAENFFILRMIANDCYKIEEYYYSAKAFDAMERIEPNPEYWEGKRGAVVGLFKLVSEQKAPPEQLKEALVLLEKSRHPQVEQIANAIRKYCKHNDMII